MIHSIKDLLPLAKLAGVEKRFIERFSSRGLQAPLYRRFDEAQWADAFVKGSVRLSTLAACRAMESAKGGDPDEGARFHYVNNFHGDIDTDWQPVPGLRMTNAVGTQLREIRYSDRSRDAFVLCLSVATAEPACARGERPYLVRVNNPLILFLQITAAVRKRFPLSVNSLKPEQQPGFGFGYMNYQERQTAHPQPIISGGKAPWVKPTVPFIDEQEVRMLWCPTMRSFHKETFLIYPRFGLLERVG